MQLFFGLLFLALGGYLLYGAVTGSPRFMAGPRGRALERLLTRRGRGLFFLALALVFLFWGVRELTRHAGIF